MNKKQIKEVSGFQVSKFFMGCVWDFKAYPDEEVSGYFSRKKNAVLDLSGIARTPLFKDIKDIFVCMFVNGEPYTYNSKAFPFMFYIHEFMQGQGYADFSCIMDAEAADSEWQEFWKDKGKKDLYNLRYVISKCRFTLLEYRDDRTGLDRNLWRISDMHINDERLNKTRDQATMNFWKIENEENRELLKLWFKHMIGATELAYSTIYERFSLCSSFLDYIKDKSLLDVTHDDIENFRAGMGIDRRNHLLGNLTDLYQYLQTKKLFTGKIPIVEQDYVRTPVKYIKNSVSDYTIMEMFKHIHTLPADYLLMYLIDLFTGIRISDICQLKTDCLYSNEHGYFLAHDCQKMQDAGAIPIAKELYDMVQERINYCVGNGHQYLFPSSRDKNIPCNAGTYRRNMQKIVSGWGIKNADGTPYHFVTHAYRHTIATTLANMGMPSALIQIGILHHTEINMSRHYIEDDAETQLRLINEKGINTPGTGALTENSALPNGFCCMPLRIACTKANACLHCDYFRTSLRFLEVHEKHLEILEEKIEYFRANGYLPNLKSAEKEKEKLELIIAKLKELEGGKEYGTDKFITTD